MKKVLQFGCLSIVGFFVFILVIGLIFGPPAEDTATLPVEVEQESPPAEYPPLPNPKMLVWDKTPAEQGLKVGDWIRVQGRANGYIGARSVRRGDKNYELSGYFPDINPMSGNYFIRTIRGGRVLQIFELDYSEGFFSDPPFFQLESPEKYVKSLDPTQLYSPKIKIGHVWVFNIPDPRKSAVFRQYNLLMFHDKDDVAELAISGRITKISDPETHEGVARYYIDIEYDEGCILELTDAQISQAMQEAKETAASVMQKFSQ